MKPKNARKYTPDQTALARATCLYVATKLGDLMDDIVVVGGLVPSLLIDQASSNVSHVGTLDLDIGLALGLFEHACYHTLTERLRDAGFTPDTNHKGQLTRQRWVQRDQQSVCIDFLISPLTPEDRGGKLFNIEHDFAAIIAPGLSLAFRDRQKILLSGKTIFGEEATRNIWVCGPGAFVILKALAFAGRGENKDAYDLYYVVRNFGSSIDDVVISMSALLADKDAQNALAILRRDFLEHEAIGPRRVAQFISGTVNDEIQSDVVNFIGTLLRRLAALFFEERSLEI